MLPVRVDCHLFHRGQTHTVTISRKKWFACNAQGREQRSRRIKHDLRLGRSYFKTSTIEFALAKNGFRTFTACPRMLRIKWNNKKKSYESSYSHILTHTHRSVICGFGSSLVSIIIDSQTKSLPYNSRRPGQNNCTSRSCGTMRTRTPAQDVSRGQHFAVPLHGHVSSYVQLRFARNFNRTGP